MKLIRLTMVTGRQLTQAAVQAGAEDVEDGEDDGIVQFPSAQQTEETTTPVWVVAEHIRSFNARKPDRNGQPRAGTRLTFVNSAGMAVTEPVEEVRSALTAE